MKDYIKIHLENEDRPIPHNKSLHNQIDQTSLLYRTENKKLSDSD